MKKFVEKCAVLAYLDARGAADRAESELERAEEGMALAWLELCRLGGAAEARRLLKEAVALEEWEE